MIIQQAKRLKMLLFILDKFVMVIERALINFAGNLKINLTIKTLTAEGKSAAESMLIRRPLWHIE